MNRVFTAIMLVTLTILIISDPNAVLPAMLGAGSDAVELSFSLMGIFVVWMGIMNILEATGAGTAFERALKPVTRFLFGKQHSDVYKYASLNISANMLGMGSAATPMGIKTIEYMKSENGTASDAMIMLLVINATSIQLLPTTVIALRASFGSASPADIILPSLIATTISTATGIVLAKLCAIVSRKLAARKKLRREQKKEKLVLKRQAETRR